MYMYEKIGLLYTRTCPLACEHCIIESSPKATGKIEYRAAAAMLPVIARHTKTVCFTGGEPLLYFAEIVKLVEAAKKLGLITNVVSGAGWVRKPEVARRRMARLKEAGLDKLCISADRYHEVHSPRERAHLLVESAQRAGIEVIVRGVVGAHQRSSEEKARFAPGDIVYDPGRLVRLGAARNLPKEHFHYWEQPPTGRCKIALWPVIEPDGNVYTCCGPSRYAKKPSPLMLGNVNEEPLDLILTRAAKDPLLQALALIGPHGILQLLKSRPETEHLVPVRPEYTGLCELCFDLTESLEIVAAARARLTENKDAQDTLAAAALWLQARKQYGAAPQSEVASRA